MGWGKALGIGALGALLTTGAIGRCARDESPQEPGERAFNLSKTDEGNHDIGALQAMVGQVAEGRDSIRDNSVGGFILGETTETLLAERKECSDKQIAAIQAARKQALDVATLNPILLNAGPAGIKPLENGVWARTKEFFGKTVPLQYFTADQQICLGQDNALYETSTNYPALGAIVTVNGIPNIVYTPEYFNGTDAQRAKMEYRALHPNKRESITPVMPFGDGASPRGKAGRDFVADAAEAYFTAEEIKEGNAVIDFSIGALEARAKGMSTSANTYTVSPGTDTNGDKSSVLGTGPFVAIANGEGTIYGEGQYKPQVDDSGRNWEAMPHGQAKLSAPGAWSITARFIDGEPNYQQSATFCDTVSCIDLQPSSQNDSWWECTKKQKDGTCKTSREYTLGQDPADEYDLKVTQ